MEGEGEREGRKEGRSGEGGRNRREEEGTESSFAYSWEKIQLTSAVFQTNSRITLRN